MSPNIVVLGSCRHAPYNVTVPHIMSDVYNTEEGYEIACKVFYPAMDEADIVFVWCQDGIIGEHTKRDIQYAYKAKKKVYFISPYGVTQAYEWDKKEQPKALPS